MSGVGNFTRKLSIRKSKRKDKKKDGKTEGGNEGGYSGVQGATNLPLVLTENSRLISENRTLRVELELERARNKERNSFVFCGDNGRANAEQQTHLSGDVDITQYIREMEEEKRDMKNRIHCLEKQIDLKYERAFELEKVNRDLKKRVQRLEEENDLMTKSHNNKITGLLNQLLASTPPDLREEMNTLNRHMGDLQKSMERQKPTNPAKISETDISGLEELKDLMATCSETTIQRFDMLEDVLARELKANLLKQEKTMVPDIPDDLKMSSDIKTFAWKLQTYMVTMDKVGHLGRALGVEPEAVDKLLNRKKTTPRDAFWAALCTWFRQNPDKATVECIWKACQKAGIDIDHQMPEHDRLVLEHCYSYLENNLMPSITLPYLRDEGVFDNSDIYHVTSQPMRRERCCALLTLLPLLGVRAFDVFCSALRQSGQEHLAQTLEEEREISPEQLDRQRLASSDLEDTKRSSSDGATMPKARFFACDQQGIIIKILATIMTKVNHIEAITSVTY